MTNLMHNYVIEYVYYYDPLHISSNSVLIISRSNCINTSSDIVFSVSDRPACKLCTPDGQLQRILHQSVHTGPSLPENTIPDAVLIQFDLLMMSTELLETCRGS